MKKKKLVLRPTDKEGLSMGVRKDGKVYSVRDDRGRYFYPEEWVKFYNSLKPSKQPIFDCLINTGARIDEVLHLRKKDIDFSRKTITLHTTKTKAAKGERKGKRRTFVISSQYANRLRKYTRNKKDSELLFKITSIAVYQMLRRKLEEIKIKDWYNFSLHNIRKTHGNWLKALGVEPAEICLRLGHDYGTFLKHYGSATIFDRKDKTQMIKILGDIYGS